MKPDYPELRDLLLAMAEERQVDRLLACITRQLCRHPDVALARIWRIAPGDRCASCPLAAECPGHVPCLHLAASAGTPHTPGADWSRIDGDFQRFPIGVRKIGRIATGEALCVEEIEDDSQWIARPEWARREGIRGFGGTPLVHRDEVLGVLGVFTRSRFCPDTVAWLRIIADHAASALVTSRAFEEIEALRDQLAVENEYLREEVDGARAGVGLVGESPALARVLERIRLVAPTDANVLIQGPSGTGKELVSREIHRQSRRAERPLVQVNCAAIPAELYESEFFGHTRGAFTGATRDRAGRFAAAHGGTLFLDEIGEIPLSLQGKLLRVLQEGRYERVGEDRSREVDVRVIAATNRDLRREVEAGRFREDLYYRLDVFPIEVPALRERREDIVPLAEHFLRLAASREGRRPPRLGPGERRRLEAYDWPGNVRELQNAIERAFILWRGGPFRVELAGSAAREGHIVQLGALAKDPIATDAPILTEEEMRSLERENLRRVLAAAEGRIAGPGGAAERLGLPPTTLASRVRKLGLGRGAAGA
ncbi:MAG: sigma 54-interacting transcriptional regulator [Myxococcota bacterium]|nr:sigma 54-interacting transcriptional regulator [Myxococcales bacterium]